MMVVSFNPGDKVKYLEQEYLVKAAIDLQKVLIVNIVNNLELEAKISDLTPAVAEKSSITRELSLITAEEWQVAKNREKILKSLAKEAVCTSLMAQKAGKQLGLSQRQIYNLIKIYRASGYELLSLIPNKTNGGKGKSRIKSDLEYIIDFEIRNLYLSKQKIKSSKLVEAIRLNCFNKQLNPPSKNTILRRLANCFSAQEVASKRLGGSAKAKYIPVKGKFPQQQYPLQVYQIDHTKVDLIVVDELYRQPIGRPYITVIIDVYSRCIAGFCLTLEPPSAMSVGLSLVHAVLSKECWLASRNIEAEWPIWGKPEKIYVDNAKEFHSEALRRGCEAHGIELDYRPIGKAHYGGIIERLIGTLMQLIHQLPGTTFSNVKERGEYNSEEKASLTLSELEKWLAVAVTNYYHKKLHTGLNKPPIEQYREGIMGSKNRPGCGYPGKIYDGQRFLIDFLPIEFRTLQREGFVLDHIAYYSNCLKPFIADRIKYGKFLIRRDPRDLSKIYILEPESHEYIEIPYRTIYREGISLWEHRLALQYLKQQGLKQVDEVAIFQAIEEMREISKTAVARTKTARRKLEIAKQNKFSEVKALPSLAAINENIEEPVKQQSVIYEAEWW